MGFSQLSELIDVIKKNQICSFKPTLNWNNKKINSLLGNYFFRLFNSRRSTKKFQVPDLHVRKKYFSNIMCHLKNSNTDGLSGVRVLDAKIDDPSIPGLTWYKERIISYKLSFDRHTNT